MKLLVVGMDPSMSAWGIASGELDLTTGILDTPTLTLIEPIKPTGKQVRQNSIDLQVSEQLSKAAFAATRFARAVFVEVPHGSQSARAMASYGICVGILGSLRAEGVHIIEVNADETKLAFTAIKNASKRQMTAHAVALYPEANWPLYEKNGPGYKKGDVAKKAEHVADAIAAIHAGVQTPLFKNIMRVLDSGDISAGHSHPGRDRNGHSQLHP